MKDQPIILIDDTCTLCNSSVAFIVKNESDNRFRFVSLYSDEGKRFVQDYGLPDGYDESIVLLENNRAYIKSEAVLRILKKLRNPYPLLYWLKYIPRFLRDSAYMFVSKHRHRIF